MLRTRTSVTLRVLLRRNYDTPVLGRKFHVRKKFAKRIQDTIKRIQIGKAEGADETAAEMLKIQAKLQAEVVCELWKAVGRIFSVPKQWHEIQLFPIFKDGSQKDTKNYRPIFHPSHVRKVVERAVDREIRSVVTFQRF